MLQPSILRLLLLRPAVACLTAGLLLSTSAFSAPDKQGFKLPEFHGLIAGAISIDDLPYEQINSEQQPSLLVFGRLGDVFIEGNRVGLPLNRFGFATLSALGQLRTHQYLDASETDLTSRDRDKSIEAGPQLSIPLGNGLVSQFSVLQDISNTHKGQEYEAALYKRFSFNDLRIVATLAAQYQSEKLADYYVGTESYHSRSDLTKEIELLATYDFNEDWSAVAVWRYYLHGDEYKDSPLTSSDHTERTALGIGYRF